MEWMVFFAGNWDNLLIKKARQLETHPKTLRAGRPRSGYARTGSQSPMVNQNTCLLYSAMASLVASYTPGKVDTARPWEALGMK